MDYSELTTPQLQAECKRRGLPSGRVKAQLVERLEAADAMADGEAAAGGGMSVEAEPERVVNEAFPQPDRPEPEPEAVAPQRVVDIPDPVPGLPPTVFRCTFPAAPEGPSEEQHAARRAQTRQAAAEAGLTTRGDARRVGTADGCDVYEVSVRREA